MKKFLLFQIIAVVIFTSCEKVIDFPLKDTPPKTVIEAVINSLDHSATLYLTQSDNYYDTSGFTGLSGAIASIQNSNGVEYVLESLNPGVYRATNIPVEEDSQYKLSVELQGNKYDAVSYLPESVPVDSVYYRYSNESLFAPEGYRVWANFTDPANQTNYYRLKLYVNGIDVTSGVIYLWSDATADGSQVEYIFYRHALQPGDQFRVELWSIDKTTYDYLFALQNTVTGNQNASLAAPANPENNISGDVLGYFTAAAVTSGDKVTITTK